MSVRRRIGIVLALFGCFVAAAASDMAAVRLRPGEVLRGRFVQVRTMEGFARPLRSEGRFTVAPQYGLIWSVEKPFATATVITAKGLVQTTGGTETFNLAAGKAPFVARLYGMIGGMLTGDMSALAKTFAVERSGGDGAWRVRMVPLKRGDPAMPFSEIRAKGGRFVEEVRMIRPGGDADALAFDDCVRASGPLTPAERAAFGIKTP
jgi:hypothetical protein